MTHAILGFVLCVGLPVLTVGPFVPYAFKAAKETQR